MVEQLSYADHNMAKALEDYTDIQPADNQTVGLIAQMFAIIERMSKRKVSRDSKDGNKRAFVVNTLDTLGVNNAQRINKLENPWGECRNGSNCTFNGCKFTHPNDYKNNNSKQVFDNANKTGGKCEAQGCPAKGESKQLCTTCFKTLLSDGTIKSACGHRLWRFSLWTKRHVSGFQDVYLLFKGSVGRSIKSNACSHDDNKKQLHFCPCSLALRGVSITIELINPCLLG